MPRTGIEPVTQGFSVPCSTNWASWANGELNKNGRGCVTWACRKLAFVRAKVTRTRKFAHLWANVHPMNAKHLSDGHSKLQPIGDCSIFHPSCGRRIWTYDLRVMSPTSFQTALSRDINKKFSLLKRINGRRRIRTFESIANRFTVCPLWPLGNPPISRWSDSNW